MNVFRTFFLLAAGLAPGGLTLSACKRGEPPAPLGDPSAAPLAVSAAPARATTSVVVDAAPVAPVASAETDGEQTRDKPSASSAAFRARVDHLFHAIQKNDAGLAKDSFFPVAAYEKVKAVPNARGDHERRLLAAFARDIATLYKRHGEKWADAKLTGVEVPEERARWVLPGEEGNKLGYYRVYRTRISYTLDEAPYHFDITSLISWRGEWYVVHLSSFK